MSLEKTLAEVEILAEDMANRAHLTESGEDSVLKNRIKELVADVQNMELAHKNARNYLREKKKSLGAGTLGQVTISQKNLADNLNRIMQIVYSGREYPISDDNINLRNIERDTQTSPQLKNGKSMHEGFIAFHRQDNTVTQTRGKTSHGNVLATISETDRNTRKTYGIKERYYVISNGKPVGAMKWMKRETEKYLEGAKEILEVISQEGPEFFASKEEKPKSAQLRRLRNFKDRHETGARIAFRTGILLTGLFGGMYIDEYRDRQTAEENLNQALYVLGYEHGIRSAYDNWESLAASDLKDSLLIEAIRRQIEHLGKNSVDKNHPLYPQAIESQK